MYSTYKRKSISNGTGESGDEPASDEAVKATKLFIESIRKKEPPEKAFRHLGKTSNFDIMRWLDDNDLDLMHRMIIMNSPESVEFLLSHGYFQFEGMLAELQFTNLDVQTGLHPLFGKANTVNDCVMPFERYFSYSTAAPFEPKTNLYAHLACVLGHRTCLNMILQYRRDDNRASKKLTYDPKTNATVERKREITPLDVAAEAEHLNCVKQLLDQSIIKDHPDFAKYPYVALACIPGSYPALQLIMKKDKPKPDDKKKAIEIALQFANARCLDALLEEKMKTDDMFGKKNFYHMLYTFSQTQSFGTDGYRRLPEVTQVLVKRKFNVTVKSPPNTYPLYSLVKNSLCIHDYVNTRHYIMCMRILIDAGADPNFDEVEYEKKLNQKGVKTEHGRHSYSSAMHCLLETVESFSEYLESKALAVRFIIQMAEVLLQNKARINTVGRIGDKLSNKFGTVLHQFAKSSVVLGVDADVFKYLLRQGADPNAKVNGKYVINTFFDTMFAGLKEFKAYSSPPDHTEDTHNMLALAYFMHGTCIKDTLKILKSDHARNPPQHIKKYIALAIKELESRIQEVWPLKRLCRTLIWDLCGRDASVVTKLPTDIESRTYILPSI